MLQSFLRRASKRSGRKKPQGLSLTSKLQTCASVRRGVNLKAFSTEAKRGASLDLLREKKGKIGRMKKKKKKKNSTKKNQNRHREGASSIIFLQFSLRSQLHANCCRSRRFLTII